jgi:hypothetical protein
MGEDTFQALEREGFTAKVRLTKGDAPSAKSGRN